MKTDSSVLIIWTNAFLKSEGLVNNFEVSVLVSVCTSIYRILFFSLSQTSCSFSYLSFILIGPQLLLHAVSFEMFPNLSLMLLFTEISALPPEPDWTITNSSSHVSAFIGIISGIFSHIMEGKITPWLFLFIFNNTFQKAILIAKVTFHLPYSLNEITLSKQ